MITISSTRILQRVGFQDLSKHYILYIVYMVISKNWSFYNHITISKILDILTVFLWLTIKYLKTLYCEKGNLRLSKTLSLLVKNPILVCKKPHFQLRRTPSRLCFHPVFYCGNLYAGLVRFRFLRHNLGDLIFARRGLVARLSGVIADSVPMLLLYAGDENVFPFCFFRFLATRTSLFPSCEIDEFRWWGGVVLKFSIFRGRSFPILFRYM